MLNRQKQSFTRTLIIQIRNWTQHQPLNDIGWKLDQEQYSNLYKMSPSHIYAPKKQGSFGLLWYHYQRVFCASFHLELIQLQLQHKNLHNSSGYFNLHTRTRTHRVKGSLNYKMFSCKQISQNKVRYQNLNHEEVQARHSEDQYVRVPP